MTDNNTIPASIATALVKAQQAINAVPKDSQAHAYKYASTEAITIEARSALHSAGLAMVGTGWCVEDESVSASYMLVHSDGSTWNLSPVSMPAIEGKGRPRDKAVAAALTYCQGYSLRALLQIPRVEEGLEPDTRDDSTHEPQQRPQRAPARRQSNGGGHVMPYGRSKGTPIAEASTDDLTWILPKIEERCSDPKWGDRNRALANAIQSELQNRLDAEAPQSAGEMFGDEDIPF